MPAISKQGVMERAGRPAFLAPSVHFQRMEGTTAVFVVGSGRYHFTSVL